MKLPVSAVIDRLREVVPPGPVDAYPAGTTRPTVADTINAHRVAKLIRNRSDVKKHLDSDVQLTRWLRTMLVDANAARDLRALLRIELEKLEK